MAVYKWKKLKYICLKPQIKHTGAFINVWRYLSVNGVENLVKHNKILPPNTKQAWNAI